jgi:DNA-binding LacI/PurR family transcriptional regulator
MHGILQDLPRYVSPVGLIFASYGEEKVVKSALGLGVPIVLLDHDLPAVQAHSVRDDSYQAAVDAVKYLAQRGHRHIAFVNWQREELNPWRLHGYRDGLRQAGLPRRRAWEIAVPLNRSGAQQAVQYLLQLRPRPTAVYCFNNTLARYVWEELERQQVAVPRDVSLIGGGGETVPDLCCHQADWEGMGQLAVEVLLRHAPPEAAGMELPRTGKSAAQVSEQPRGARNGGTRHSSSATAAPGQPSALLEHHVCPHRFYEGKTVAPCVR